MKLILTKRVPKLGENWEVVNVKDGYARNFLLPQKLARPATPALIKKAEAVKAERLKKLEEVIAKAKEVAEKLEGTVLSFKKKSREGKLYGSVTEKEIIEALAAECKVEISKEMVKIGKPVKTLGEHKITLHLAEGVEVKVKVVVEEEEK
ncbi:50S ribosomal protein L9 [Candidatus Peregrinibacteria bacterium]|nr:50S ribosomal protein L9 [Candidatus Peregrinibacteria bacterium]